MMEEIQARKLQVKVLRRDTYTNFTKLYLYIRDNLIHCVINCAGFIGKPNVDQCEGRWLDTLQGNTLLTSTVGHACSAANVVMVQISSGCIYNGPGPYAEDDTPNFSFRSSQPCSYYSGTKALAEELLADVYKLYICRLRLPFDEFDGPRNYLSKLQRYPKLLRGRNSLSHRSDFVTAVLDLSNPRCNAAYGTYNMTNPGSVTTEEVAAAISNRLRVNRHFEYFENDEEFYKTVIAPRSNCVLKTDKLAEASVVMRPVWDALGDALDKWQWESRVDADAPPVLASIAS